VKRERLATTVVAQGLMIFFIAAQVGLSQAQVPSVPSAEELFLRGTFQPKKPWHRFLDFNRFGRELDLSERRPVVDLSGTVFEQKYGREGSHLIANFYHGGRFFIARLPKDGVKSINFQLNYFPPRIPVLKMYFAAHALLRFEMNPDQPIELVAEMPDELRLETLRAASQQDRVNLLPFETEATTIRLKNIGVSAEAQWTKDDRHQAYDLVRGALGNFVQIIRFVSMQERFENFFAAGDPVTQIDFQVEDPDKRSAILLEAIKASQSDGIKKLYDTFWFNCTTRAFDIVQKVLGNDLRLGFIRAFIQRRIPTVAAFKAMALGGRRDDPMNLDLSLAGEAQAALDAHISRNGRLFTKQGPSQREAIIKAIEHFELQVPAPVKAEIEQHRAGALCENALGAASSGPTRP
jgi:hypothetical protein